MQVVNNGNDKVCSATVKMNKNGATVQSLWNLDAAGSDQYKTPSWVQLAKGQSHTAGAVVQGSGIPSFSVVSSQKC